MTNQRRVEEKKFSAERSQIMLSGHRVTMNKYQRPNSQPQDEEATGHTTGHQ